MDLPPYGNARGMATAAGDRTLWEHLLAEDWNQAGVGHRALGLPFNTWMYRVRREVFLREADALGLDPHSAHVLDVGSGTGFYIRRWLELGVGSITGCDLTESAVERLRSRFPGVEIRRADIADPDDSIPRDAFDAVSCIDVLFHITDDGRYRDAVHHLARLVRPGGHVSPVREPRPRAGAARPSARSTARWTPSRGCCSRPVSSRCVECRCSS
jgi:SAM-dependent methyltransferase